MSISKSDAELMFNLGFKRQIFEEKVRQTDIYKYRGETWCIGGRILPNPTITVNSDIYREGIWLPCIEDFIYWLDYNDCTYFISFTGTVYKIEIQDMKGDTYKARAATMEYVFCKGIIKILEKYKGDIIDKNCKVIEAEYLGEEEL